MRFGVVPLEDARGAILAHTLRLAHATLRKGTVLGAPELSRLREAGMGSVMVARLGEDDVPEDLAAGALASAAAGACIRVGDATAGRCNLFAEVPGLVVVREEGVHLVNDVDESLTLATLPSFQRVHAGELVGTVKVIPFAAPRAALERCTRASSGGLIAVHPFRPLAAMLLMTRLPGTRDEILERARGVLEGRLRQLGGSLDRVRVVTHDPVPVSEALGELLASNPSAVFVLGASAALDRGDVLPAAIVRSGGTVERLGIPVDPGNLLLLASKGGVPIIGMPGCARSPRPSGFDRVLERIAAGLEIEPGALARLGVGGLLKEIPSRPRPRESGGSAPAPDAAGAGGAEGPRVGAVVLAAGRSSRMGANKLIEVLEGVPLVARVVDTALEAGATPVVVVTGHQREAVEGALGDRPVERAHNPRWEEGMGTSLAVGIRALEGRVDGVLVCLGDMPRVAADGLRSLLSAFRSGEAAAAWVPVHGGKRGNPVLWAASWFPRLAAIEGDRGARLLLAELEDEVVEVAVSDAGVLLDVDTRAALEQARGEAGREP